MTRFVRAWQTLATARRPTAFECVAVVVGVAALVGVLTSRTADVDVDEHLPPATAVAAAPPAAAARGEDEAAVSIVPVATDRFGVVQSIEVADNTPVHAGQVLMRLDSSSLDDELRRAQANLEEAETQEIELRVACEDARTKFIRAEQLAERALVAPVELEAARAALDAADERLRDGEAQVARSEDAVRLKSEERARNVIRAPVDGIVHDRSVAVGQTLSGAPTTLLTIATGSW